MFDRKFESRAEQPLRGSCVLLGRFCGAKSCLLPVVAKSNPLWPLSGQEYFKESFEIILGESKDTAIRTVVIVSGSPQARENSNDPATMSEG